MTNTLARANAEAGYWQIWSDSAGWQNTHWVATADFNSVYCSYLEQGLRLKIEQKQPVVRRIESGQDN